MTLRTPRERLIQTLSFEIGGIAMAAPTYALIFGPPEGGGLADGLVLMTSLSLAVMVCSPFHNALFDLVEYRQTGRLASDRPQAMRLVHAVSHEVTAMLVTLPLIVWIGGLGLRQAVLFEIGLTLFYVAYAFAFHLVYDRLRPVVPRALAQGAGS